MHKNEYKINKPFIPSIKLNEIIKINKHKIENININELFI